MTTTYNSASWILFLRVVYQRVFVATLRLSANSKNRKGISNHVAQCVYLFIAVAVSVSRASVRITSRGTRCFTIFADTAINGRCFPHMVERHHSCRTTCFEIEIEICHSAATKIMVVLLLRPNAFCITSARRDDTTLRRYDTTLRHEATPPKRLYGLQLYFLFPTIG